MGKLILNKKYLAQLLLCIGTAKATFDDFVYHKGGCIYGSSMVAPEHPRKVNRDGPFSDGWWVIENSTPKECAAICEKTDGCVAFEYGNGLVTTKYTYFHLNDCLFKSGGSLTSPCPDWNLDIYIKN